MRTPNLVSLASYDDVPSWEKFVACLTIWREARGESTDAQVMVGEVIAARARLRPHLRGSLYMVVTERLQFSSMTAWRDPQLHLYPDVAADESWHRACVAMRAAYLMIASSDDLSAFPTHYRDVSIDPPAWAAAMRPIARIGRLVFYHETIK